MHKSKLTIQPGLQGTQVSPSLWLLRMNSELTLQDVVFLHRNEFHPQQPLLGLNFPAQQWGEGNEGEDEEQGECESMSNGPKEPGFEP